MQPDRRLVNLIPRVFHLASPEGVKEERPWFRLVICLSDKFSILGGVPAFLNIVAACVCHSQNEA